MYKYRYLQRNLERRPSEFRALLLTGPRRSGKSTLCKHLQTIWGGGSYVSFDTPLDQARFRADPEGFLATLKTPAVLDEIQNVPDLFQYLKALIDREPHRGLDYILTGSQHFQMMHRVSESLAGRILIKELFPFSLAELTDAEPDRVLSNISKILELNPSIELSERHRSFSTRDSIRHLLAVGGFPQASFAQSQQAREEWFSSYTETYIQRDIRALSNVHNLSTFSRFVNLVAGRTGQVINYSGLGKDIGVSYKTAQHYLSLLETSYLWRSLAPFYKASSEKRLSKSPKGIFTDSGLGIYLVGLNEDGIERNPLLGAFFESFVVMEIVKLVAALGARVQFCHFRAGESAEVDLVLEHGRAIIPIEIKCSASVDPSWGKGIRVLREVLDTDSKQRGFVVSLHSEVKEIQAGVWNLPITALC